MIEQSHPGSGLSVDGRIDEVTAPLAIAAGANVLMAGSSMFGANNSLAAAVEELRNAISPVGH